MKQETSRIASRAFGLSPGENTIEFMENIIGIWCVEKRELVRQKLRKDFGGSNNIQCESCDKRYDKIKEVLKIAYETEIKQATKHFINSVEVHF